MNNSFINQISNLHKSGISTGFLSTLSSSFLSRLYKAISDTAFSKVFVIIGNEISDVKVTEQTAEMSINQPAGFIACSLDTSKMYQSILIRNWLQFMVYLVPSFFSINNIKRMVQTILYGFKKKSGSSFGDGGQGTEECKAELLSIVVDAEYRGRGAGKRLIGAMEEYFKNSGIRCYKVVTWSGDEAANAFYRAVGFRFRRSFEHHGKVLNEYVKELEDKSATEAQRHRERRNR